VSQVMSCANRNTHSATVVERGYQCNLAVAKEQRYEQTALSTVSDLTQIESGWKDVASNGLPTPFNRTKFMKRG
jgi:hypothetical protein